MHRKMSKLLVLFVAIPLLELYLLTVLGQRIGLLETIGLVVLAGVAGAALARSQGRRVLQGWQESLAQGRMPEDGVLDGLLVLIGGVLLIAPGVLTDLVGVLLLLPPTRRIALRLVRARVARGVKSGSMRVVWWGGRSPSPPAEPRFRPERPNLTDETDAEVVD
jgi:UPF0716 protein FxsA